MGITIKRYDQSVNAELDYRVYVDFQYIIDIRNGETIYLDAPFGAHSIYLEVDDFITKAVEFELYDNEEKYFICGSKMPDKKGIQNPFSVRKMSHFAYIELEGN